MEEMSPPRHGNSGSCLAEPHDPANYVEDIALRDYASRPAWPMPATRSKGLN